MGCKGGAGVRKSEWEVFGRALKCQQVLWQQGELLPIVLLSSGTSITLLALGSGPHLSGV